MTEKNEGELTENELSKLADMLVERMEKRKEKLEEAKKKLAEKEEAAKQFQPYAVCIDCGHGLSEAQYNGANCPYCAGTKARIIAK